MQQPAGQLDQVFFALSDGTRRAILSRLAEGPTTVGELAQPFSISPPAISRHMKILEKAGLIERRISGRQHHCSLNAAALHSAEDWIGFHRRFWESRLDALQALLSRQDSA